MRNAHAHGLLVLLLGSMLTLGCSKQHVGPWIHKISFAGVKKVSVKDLRSKLAVQESSWFPLAPKKYLETPFTVEVDRDRIEAFYHSRGYFAAKVTQAKTQPYKGDKAVDIAFAVDEGEPTKVHTLQVEGLQALGAEAATDRLPLAPEQIFDHDQYLAAKQQILGWLQRHGYAFAKVDGAVEINRDTRLAEVKIVADPGTLTRLGEAHVHGTKLISAPLVEKHAAVPTGAVYQPRTLEGIKDKLYSLGVFDTVKVEPLPRPNQPDIADIDIAVSEGKMRELKVGGGFGIEPERNDVHAEVDFTQRRFLGGLRTLQLGLQPGYAVMPALWETQGNNRRHGPTANFKADLTQPDLLGKNSSLTFSLGYDLGLEYAYQYHGPGLRLGVQRGLWENRIRLGAGYNFQFLQFFNEVANAVGSLFGYTNPYRLGYFQEQFELDLRNRPLDASKGFYLRVVGEQGGVYTGSAFSYQKLQPEVRGYVSVGAHDRVTFAARIQFGQLWVQKNENGEDFGSPVTQRLYLGGPGSHRGFSYNRLSYQVCTAQPKNEYYANLYDCLYEKVDDGLSDANKHYASIRRLPTGGDQMLLGQFEIRVKLFKLFGNWLSLVAFTDVGDVAAPEQPCTDVMPGEMRTQDCPPEKKRAVVPYPSAIDLTKLHIAVGGGLRYRTVIGTVRFDLGVRLNRLAPVEDGIYNPDPGQQVVPHISIGEAF